MFLLTIFFTFSSCEKDSYENPIHEQRDQGKINYVTIDDVPFLTPNVENFKSSTSLTKKSNEDLNLDLQHIVEYEGANDFKSYSIPVINKSIDNDTYYFENLHVIKDGDKYENIIVRYTPADITKKFELNKFTGKMEFFNDQKILKSTIYFENGKAIKVQRTTNKITGIKTSEITAILEDPVPDDGSDYGDGSGCNCPSPVHGDSLLTQFFNWITGLFSNINITATSGDPSNTGYVLTVTPPNMGTGYSPSDSNTYNGSASVVIVPSQAQSEYQRMQITEIKRKLGTIDATAFLWLIDPNNASSVNDIYYVLNQEEENTPETLDFLRDAVICLKDGGEVDYWYKVFVHKSLRNNPCLFGVYNQLGQAPTFEKYLRNFDGEFSVAHLMLKAGVDPIHPDANAVTYPPNNYWIDILFNPNNLHRPPLDIARTFIHEMIHAEIYRKLLSCAKLPNVNINNMTDSQWQTYIHNLKNNFPGLFDYYMRYLYSVPADQQISDTQHELMAQHYRQIIIQVLKQYDNNQHSDEFYNALAWIGLMGEGEIEVDSVTGLPPVPSVAWKNVPLDQRLQILSIYKNFLKNNPPCQ
ncbi:hypothetical protein [Flavobacterium sp.]|uniref:hypothetical protein n=1 Tax=Flavobacterium sp. TaxID=239 RepID=UPI002D7F324A|nr:hypothetical protein [Flavobacterium sp.]